MIKTAEHHFYWPSRKRDVARLIGQCHTCQLVKQRMQNTSLYTLPFLNCSWQDVSVNFVLGFSNTA